MAAAAVSIGGTAGVGTMVMPPGPATIRPSFSVA